MSEDGLDPVIHAPARLRIAVTLAALRDGDDLSFTKLQDLIGLTPGNLITHLRKLEDAGYVSTHRNGSGVTARTSVALTGSGRAALERYTTVLRQLLDSASQRQTRDLLPDAPALTPDDAAPRRAPAEPGQTLGRRPFASRQPYRSQKSPNRLAGDHPDGMG
jgi:DNA-binding MarR family transcriptional regulator